MSRAELRRLVEAQVCAVLGATAVTRLCPACGGTDHGRPALRMVDPPDLSLSYAGRLALAAWTHDGPVGVDLAEVGPPVGGYGERRDWTRAEAILKATGEGLRRDPRDGLPPAWTGPLAVPHSWLATVAVLGTHHPDPEIHWLTAER